MTAANTHLVADHEELASVLDRAARLRQSCGRSSDRAPLALDTAYAVQRVLVARRLGRGAHPVGVKLGFTSRAKAVQMGVDDVILGQLTSDMLVADGAQLNLADYVHPRVEPEVAFRLGRDVAPDEPHALAASAVDAVAPAMEIIDSRYQDFRFDLGDVVADNTSAASFVLGSWQQPSAGLQHRGVRLSVDGRTVASGSTAAILGDPLRAVTAAARLAARYGIALTRGSVLLAGAATAAVALAPDTYVDTSISGLGRVGFTVLGATHSEGESS